MHKIIHGILWVVLFIIVLGCDNGSYQTKFGSPITNRTTIPIAAIFEDTSAYEGKMVTVEGIIDMQDQKGFWFYVQDKEARIYGEIDNAAFSIPDLTEKKILVQGVIEVNFKIPFLSVTGVEQQG